MESLQARAEQHLRVIRAAMESATSFTALPGWGGVIMGVGFGLLHGVVGLVIVRRFGG